MFHPLDSVFVSCDELNLSNIHINICQPLCSLKSIYSLPDDTELPSDKIRYKYFLYISITVQKKKIRKEDGEGVGVDDETILFVCLFF